MCTLVFSFSVALRARGALRRANVGSSRVLWLEGSIYILFLHFKLRTITVLQRVVIVCAHFFPYFPFNVRRTS